MPGAGPHPRSFPGGSHLPELPPPAPFSDEVWRDSAHYLYAVDLFNHGFWWEAHEVLEALWAEATREASTRRFLQGLIQIAAALLKDSQSSRAGALRLAAKGLPRLRSERGVFLGLDVEPFARDVEAFLSAQSPAPPRMVLAGV